MIKILVADDHQLLRDGLAAICDREADLEVVGHAETGREAVSAVDNLEPDLVFMDVGMPDMNGIEATRQIHNDHPSVKVIGLSTHSDKRYVQGMLGAGASGYVLKAAAFNELRQALRHVMEGEVYVSPALQSKAGQPSRARTGTARGSAFDLLGPREREVLQLLAEGNTSAEIARRLHRSTRTVEAHRRNIMKKLELHTVAELTKYAIREGLSFLDS